MRMIDADVLKAGFEEDGHLTPYIESFIDACPTVGEWISVKDRLPDCINAESNSHQVTDMVLATSGGYIMFGYFDIYKYNGTWEFVSVDTDMDFDRCVTVTHWMLLPEVPKEE